MNTGAQEMLDIVLNIVLMWRNRGQKIGMRESAGTGGVMPVWGTVTCYCRVGRAEGDRFVGGRHWRVESTDLMVGKDKLQRGVLVMAGWMDGSCGMGRRSLAVRAPRSECPSLSRDGDKSREWGWSALGSESLAAQSSPTIDRLDWVRKHRNIHAGQTFQDQRGRFVLLSTARGFICISGTAQAHIIKPCRRHIRRDAKLAELCGLQECKFR